MSWMTTLRLGGLQARNAASAIPAAAGSRQLPWTGMVHRRQRAVPANDAPLVHFHVQLQHSRVEFDAVHAAGKKKWAEGGGSAYWRAAAGAEWHLS